MESSEGKELRKLHNPKGTAENIAWFNKLHHSYHGQFVHRLASSPARFAFKEGRLSQEEGRFTLRADAMSFRMQQAVAPDSGRQEWGFTPHYADPKTGMARMRMGNHTVIAASQSTFPSLVEAAKKWHFVPSRHYRKNISGWLGISGRLAGKLLKGAKEGGEPVDATVVRFWLNDEDHENPRSSNTKPFLSHVKPKDYGKYEDELRDFLVSHMPPVLEAAYKRGEVEISFHIDGFLRKSLIAVVKNKIPAPEPN